MLTCTIELIVTVGALIDAVAAMGIIEAHLLAGTLISWALLQCQKIRIMIAENNDKANEARRCRTLRKEYGTARTSLHPGVKCLIGDKSQMAAKNWF